MYDYAQAQLLGRVASEAELEHIINPERTSCARFTIACNIGVRRQGRLQKETVFRTILALGPFANYVSDCQSTGLTGRLVNIIGVMADTKIDDDEYEEIIRVAPGEGIIKIMDKRVRNHD